MTSLKLTCYSCQILNRFLWPFAFIIRSGLSSCIVWVSHLCDRLHRPDVFHLCPLISASLVYLVRALPVLCFSLSLLPVSSIPAFSWCWCSWFLSPCTYFFSLPLPSPFGFFAWLPASLCAHLNFFYLLAGVCVVHLIPTFLCPVLIKNTDLKTKTDAFPSVLLPSSVSPRRKVKLQPSRPDKMLARTFL